MPSMGASPGDQPDFPGCLRHRTTMADFPWRPAAGTAATALELPARGDRAHPRVTPAAARSSPLPSPPCTPSAARRPAAARRSSDARRERARARGARARAADGAARWHAHRTGRAARARARATAFACVRPRRLVRARFPQRVPRTRLRRAGSVCPAGACGAEAVAEEDGRPAGDSRARAAAGGSGVPALRARSRPPPPSASFRLLQPAPHTRTRARRLLATAALRVRSATRGQLPLRGRADGAAPRRVEALRPAGRARTAADRTERARALRAAWAAARRRDARASGRVRACCLPAGRPVAAAAALRTAGSGHVASAHPGASPARGCAGAPLAVWAGLSRAPWAAHAADGSVCTSRRTGPGGRPSAATCLPRLAGWRPERDD